MDQLRTTINSLRLGAAPSAEGPNRGRRHSDVGRDQALDSSLTTTIDHAWTRATNEQPFVREESHHCDAGVCSVVKTFNTPELLEAILHFLDTDNIIATRRTSRIWNATILSVPQLRLHLFARPQWGRHPSSFELLNLNLPGLRIEKGSPVDRGRWIEVTFNEASARAVLPNGRKRPRARSIYEGVRGGLGSRASRGGDPWPQIAREETNINLDLGDLHITQPPTLGMQAYIVKPQTNNGASVTLENDEDDHIPSACAKLSCNAGITMDFLAEVALSLFAEETDITGVTVVFKAIVSFYEPAQTPRKKGGARSLIRIG